ncbi:MAG: UDP-glucose 6-dehydrogenase TuaD [Fimbriimonadaceae bacterium]|nr:UDP-glucose 6-dehydrogenase TuaD [Fimbriimonadaceae bacterium]
MKVAVIGTGYVGLVSGVVFADLGNEVICVDRDPEKLAKLRAGIPPIYEPGLEEVLKRVLANGNLVISDSVREATKSSEIVFIAVGTPAAHDGTPDLTAVTAVAHEIAAAIDKPTIVVNKSTVPVGTGEMVEQIIRTVGVPDANFSVVSNPEFLREGSALKDTLHPDRVVIGVSDSAAADKMVELHKPLGGEVIVTDVKSAELIKYASNSFLAMKISFVNALSRICEMSGANVGDVARGLGTDHRIGKQFLQAGIGWGGSCFPKDVQGMIAISELLGYDFQLMKAVWDINRQQTLHFLRRVEQRLGSLAGKRVGLLGLAFKPNTDDIRDAKSVVIIEEIARKGGKVRAYDPIAMDNVKRIHPNIEYADTAYAAADDADVLILATEWEEFRDLDPAQFKARMRQPIVFDGRRFWDRQCFVAAGFDYHTVGAI